MDKKTAAPKNTLKLTSYILIMVSVVCILIALFLGFRVFHRIRHMTPPIPRQTDVNLIQGWMTIPYIAHTYAIPENLIFEKLNTPQSDKRKSLDAIAKASNKNSSDVIAEVKETIKYFEDNRPTPPPK